MSLKNYIFASINVKSSSTFQQQQRLQDQVVSSPAPAPQPPPRHITPMTTVVEEDVVNQPSEQHRPTKSGNWIKNAWSFISVEPVMICWILPSCLLYIAIENLALEKSCRVNFGYSDVVCDNMIDKSINNIDCVEVRAREASGNYTEIHVSLLNSTHPDVPFNHSDNLISDLEDQVCRAEVDSQKLDSELNFYTAPFDSIFGILMILFAGGWSDKKGKRKPCMLLPLIGECAALIVMLIAAIFMKQLPLQFSSVLGKLLPSVTGGANLMLMGVYSYLTEMTEEKDRTFRYGIFAVFVPLIPIISLPFAGILFQNLRYIKLILLCIPINVLGILYIIFVLKEVTPKKDESLEGTENGQSTNTLDRQAAAGLDNFGFEQHDNERRRSSAAAKSVNGHHHNQPRKSIHVAVDKIKHSFCVEFFNPIVAIDCMKVILKKRKNNGRKIVIILLIMYFIAIGPAFGEEPNEYNFTRIKLNWDGLTYSPFATYGNAVSLAGTMIMVGGLSKLFHISDPAVGFLATSFSSVSRLFYAAATTASMLYIARTIDMFISVRALTIKSVISTFVEAAELGRIFSIIGIIEAFAKFVFVSAYSLIYKNTLETFASAFYICSFVCLIITAIMFIFLYFVVKKKQKLDAAELLENASRRATSAVIRTSTNNETDTHM